MAVTYSAAVKTARMSAVVTAMGSTAVLEIGTAGMGSILASWALNSTPATVSGSIMQLSGMPKTSAAIAAGTAAAARIRTATGGTDVITGLTVGASGADVVIDSTTIASGQDVTINSATITHG